ncbi:hypothetical protein M0R72_07945 [Candidatus Pacearchaeota archaeon]|jgi:phage terminase large subunit-like protein|nr:hypothetical protein [Candidatus Pacearchaeota archaeon]
MTTKADIGPPVDFLVKLGNATPSGRRFFAKQSLGYLSKCYLDRELWPCQKNWNAQLRRMSRGGIISQPGAGKTELVSRIIPLDLILHGFGDIGPRNIRIGCISASKDLATKNVSLLRQDLENPKLVADYGTFKPKRGVWGERAFQVSRSARMKDPTYEAFGVGSAIIGSRFDVLILDDPVASEKDARNQDIQRELLELVKGTIDSRLAPWGVLWFLGNRKGVADLYHHLLRDRGYTVIVSPALIREPESYQIIELDEPELDEWKKDTRCRVVIHDGDQGEALCPECWPVYRLLAKRYSSGSVIFNREFQGVVSDDETALIKQAWLDACKDTNLSYGQYDRSHYVKMIQGGDPALTLSRKLAERHDTDYTVIISLGILPNGHFDLVGLTRDRGLSPQEIQDLFVNQARLHKADLQFIEVNSFGEIIHWELKDKTGVPTAAHRTTGKNKYDPYEGYPSLSVLFENGQIRLPYKTEQDRQITDALCAELNNPEQSDHDDQLSALWIAVSGARRVMDVEARRKHKTPQPEENKNAESKSGVRAFG